MSEETELWPTADSIDVLNDIMGELPPPPWKYAPDPANPGTFYVSGPADTRIVAEGMTEQDAANLVYLAGAVPQATSFWEDVRQLWHKMESGDAQGFETRALKIINDLQMRIAQYEGTTAVVPEVTTVGDLNALHVGHTVEIGEAKFNVASVHQFGDLISIDAGNGVLLYLNPDTPASIEVSPPFEFRSGEVANDPTEGEQVEADTPEEGTTEEVQEVSPPQEPISTEEIQ